MTIAVVIFCFAAFLVNILLFRWMVRRLEEDNGR